MDSTTIAIIVGIVALFLFLFIARRMFRMAVKLVFIGVIIIALLAGAAFGWWQGWFDGSATRRAQPTPTQRAPSR
ncbi:MAG TPA: hypothetical protein VGJ55_13805 [Pyrinomonadaceae bacterium]|jgi:hypothetical protein